jgi:hypothetical protein
MLEFTIFLFALKVIIIKNIRPVPYAFHCSPYDAFLIRRMDGEMPKFQNSQA